MTDTSDSTASPDPAGALEPKPTETPTTETPAKETPATQTPATDAPTTTPATTAAPATTEAGAMDAPAAPDASPEAPATETTEGEAPEATPAAAEIKELPKNNPYYWGLGRRKSSVARVRIRPGDGKFFINKKEVDDFFRLDKDRRAVRTPLNVTETRKAIDVFVNVCGGGVSGQSGAVVLGLARALVKANQDYEPALRAKNLLTRDPRKVERKKYGQRGARRRFQFSKR
jgi:small subunit ribosomal protein S9